MPSAPADVQTRIRELIKLAKEQGYLTFDDLNEALPVEVTDADELDAILTRLRRMEIDIIEASEVDRYKDGKKDTEEEEEEKPEAKLDILDDPVRMYLKQMGQVPLLTREQEVEISKRIEEAEIMVQRLINRFGFIAQAHLDLAQKLTEGGERFDRVILDKKIESRERYMKLLPRLCRQVGKLGASICQQYSQILHGPARKDAKKLKSFQKSVGSLQKLYPKFYFKQKVTEEFVHLADEQFQVLTLLQGEPNPKLGLEKRKRDGVEGFSTMTSPRNEVSAVGSLRRARSGLRWRSWLAVGGLATVLVLPFVVSAARVVRFEEALRHGVLNSNLAIEA